MTYLETPTTAKPLSWDELVEANLRARHDFVPRDGIPQHRPQIAVLACSDARLSVSRLLDLPAGSIFVVRVAGASATVEAVASLTYAVENLGVRVVAVLGHTHCGAVTAALRQDVDPSIEPLVAPIRLGLAADCRESACAVPAHVAATLTALEHDPGPLGDALRSGRVIAHGGIIDTVDGSLTPTPVKTPHH